ncbi:hypothetical protein [Nocardia xishanensis]|uniref:hypothetical protein n=1 Tax=Nocardia xishanensis TaxID=238964 RepID=UPI0012F4D6D4|nr:hypothetical protein [Nocardia xishanensis]
MIMTRPAGISGAIASSASIFAARRQFRIRPFDLAEPGLFDVRPTRNHMRFRQLPDQIFALRQQGRQVRLFDTRTGLPFPLEQPHRNLLEQNRTRTPPSLDATQLRSSIVPGHPRRTVRSVEKLRKFTFRQYPRAFEAWACVEFRTAG